MSNVEKESEYTRGFMDCYLQQKEDNPILDKAIILLKKSLENLEYLYDINWAENSEVQSTSFEELKDEIDEFLEKLEDGGKL